MNISSLASKAATTVTSTMGRQGLKLQKNSPTIMFASGVVGVVATVVLASRGTLKLEEIIDEHDVNESRMKGLHESGHPDYSETDYNSDRAKNMVRTGLKVAKIYAPAVIVGTASIGLLTGSHIVLKQRNAGLVAAFTAVNTAMEEYRARVRADVGDQKDREYRYGTQDKEIYSETKKGEPIVETVKVPAEGAHTSMYAVFFDANNPNWNTTPEKNLWFLKMHQTYLNQQLNSRGHVFLNEVYDALEMPRTPEGQVVGWIKNNPRGDGIGIDFGIWDDDKMEQMHEFMTGRLDCILLDFNVEGVVYDMI